MIRDTGAAASRDVTDPVKTWPVPRPKVTMVLRLPLSQRTDPVRGPDRSRAPPRYVVKGDQ